MKPVSRSGAVGSWDYLIVTASQERQAEAYRSQLSLRWSLGLLPGVQEVLVVPDPGGRRVGSGGSTLECLTEVAQREFAALPRHARTPKTLESVLRERRILIIHAGGDSRRLPAYGPCGKVFVPMPGETAAAPGLTLFDRIVPAFLSLPAGRPGEGQVVVTAGDVLVQFDPGMLRLDQPGLTALACAGTPAEASKHGVICAAPGGKVRWYLQKPPEADQVRLGALNRRGEALLDIGIMSFDARMILALFRAMGVSVEAGGRLVRKPDLAAAVRRVGVDFYREICCALGTEVTVEHHRREARRAGSGWGDAALVGFFDALKEVPFWVQIVRDARFLHFGTTQQLITSGAEVRASDEGRSGQAGRSAPGSDAVVGVAVPLALNTEVSDRGSIHGANAWIEGCRIKAPLRLGGQNVVVGLDVDEPLTVPPGACLEVLRGTSRRGRRVDFVRVYGVGDTFKDAFCRGATLNGWPLEEWLTQAGLSPGEVWGPAVPESERSLWNAQVFPALRRPAGYRDWLWLVNPSAATVAQRRALRRADRYSVAEMAALADPTRFFGRRETLRARALAAELPRWFGSDPGVSASELAWVLARAPEAAAGVVEVLREVRAGESAPSASPRHAECARMLHSLGSAVMTLASRPRATLGQVLPGWARVRSQPAGLRAWLAREGLPLDPSMRAVRWGEAARAKGRERLKAWVEAVVAGSQSVPAPRRALALGETVRKRAPLVLPLGGAWSLTPLPSAERGAVGAALAIEVAGLAPVTCYLRTLEERMVRLFAVDAGCRVDLREWSDLEDLGRREDPCREMKAALQVAGFERVGVDRGGSGTLASFLEGFGGGLEVTTVLGLPAEGLGATGSLAVSLWAALAQVCGTRLTRDQVFARALRYEHLLGRGAITLSALAAWDGSGAWRVGVGEGEAEGRLQARHQGVGQQPLATWVESGLILLYYAGLEGNLASDSERRIAGWLEGDRAMSAALVQEAQGAGEVVAALKSGDLEALGRRLGSTDRCGRRAGLETSDPRIDALLERVRSHLFGARVLGGRDGAWILMVCRSVAAARRLREELGSSPPNPRAAFLAWRPRWGGFTR